MKYSVVLPILVGLLVFSCGDSTKPIVSTVEVTGDDGGWFGVIFHDGRITQIRNCCAGTVAYEVQGANICVDVVGLLVSNINAALTVAINGVSFRTQRGQQLVCN